MATTTTYTVQIDTQYTKTDEGRSYRMAGISQAAIADVGTKIDAINASLVAGTAGALSSTFISDDFDTSTGTGFLEKINRSVITTTEETDLL